MTASAAAICSIAAWGSAGGTLVTDARATSTASGATSTARHRDDLQLAQSRGAASDQPPAEIEELLEFPAIEVAGHRLRHVPRVYPPYSSLRGYARRGSDGAGHPRLGEQHVLAELGD